LGQQLQAEGMLIAQPCPARESGSVGKWAVEPRGNPGASVPAAPVFGEKKPFLPRSARESTSVGTDGRRFWRSVAPALPTVPVFGAAIYLLFYLV